MSALRLVALCGVAVGVGAGCTCSDTSSPQPATVDDVSVSAAPSPAPESAEPTTPPVAGWYCENAPTVAAPPPGAAIMAPVWLAPPPAWTEPTVESEHLILVPGVPAQLRSKEEGAYLVHRRVPSGYYAVITAKELPLPSGSSFSAGGERKIFDAFAATPRTMLVGVRLREWAGLLAVEGVVASPSPMRGRYIVHHLIVPAGPDRAMVVTYVASETDYHRYLGEACNAVGAAPATTR